MTSEQFVGIVKDCGFKVSSGLITTADRPVLFVHPELPSAPVFLARFAMRVTLLAVESDRNRDILQVQYDLDPIFDSMMYHANCDGWSFVFPTVDYRG